MNLKINPFMPRSVTIASLVVLMVMMMFNADFLYHKAFALSIRTVNNTDTTNGIVRTGSQIWVSSDAGNSVRVWTTSGVLLGSIAADVFYLFAENSRVYGLKSDGLILYEFDPLNIAGGIIRTSASLTGCTTTISPTYSSTFFYCATGASNTIKMVNLSTFVVTTSTTLNTGANACNVPAALAYSATGNALIVGCNTSDNVVVIEDVETSGTPDYGTAYADNWGNLVFDSVHNQVWGAENSGTDLSIFNLDTTANTIALDETVTMLPSGVNDKGMSYDANSDRIFVYGGNNFGSLDVFDADTHARIITITPATCSGTVFTCSVFAFSSTFVYVTSGTANYYEIDMTGVPSGGGGGGVVPASVCYIDKNFDGIADYIFNDVGGPDGFPTIGHPDAGVPDGMCDWSGFGTTSPPLITDTGGGLACLTGIIPCTNGQPTDPDPATNGIGYLLVIFLLAIMILLFGVAQMKLGLGIPDWLWMIGTFAVIGFATLVGWIDNTLFIIGAVIVAALGAISFVRKFTGGF